MTFQNTVNTELAIRPERVRILAEIPLETYKAISQELKATPDWHLYFIKNNPAGWPKGMYPVIERYLGNYQDKATA